MILFWAHILCKKWAILRLANKYQPNTLYQIFTQSNKKKYIKYERNDDHEIKIVVIWHLMFGQVQIIGCQLWV